MKTGLYYFILIVFCFLSTAASVCFSLEPNEVLVLANRNASQSKGLAEYYMEKRGIPEDNLLLLWITDRETCSREDYEKKVVPPVRRYLNRDAAGKNIRCIVTIYGVPLRIKSPGSTEEEKAVLKTFADEQKEIQERLKNTGLGDEETKKLKQQLTQSRKRSKKYGRSLDRTASFDSELTLVKKENYDLKFWLVNPFFLGFRNRKTVVDKSEFLMTSRLDGPSADIVKRIVNDSIMAEKQGLSGRACFDARGKGKDQGDKKRSGYGFYDQSIHNAADYFMNQNILSVMKEDTGELFQPGSCPDTALYCGWYSLAKYIDAFTWQTGSVGYHIASSECASLKKKDSQFWCKRMLEEGIAATIGPVGEPYVQSFPVPEIFFKYLAEGYLTLAEAYFISLPYLSWKMVLVGDPLYRVNLKKSTFDEERKIQVWFPEPIIN